MKKRIITVDLNPVSRTAIWADITIVDNIIRALPEMIEVARELKDLDRNQLYEIVADFNNKENIQDMLSLIQEYIESQKEDVFKKLGS